jgi:hypothetical protein
MMIGTALATCQRAARNLFPADWTYRRRPRSNAFLVGHGFFDLFDLKIGINDLNPSVARTNCHSRHVTMSFFGSFGFKQHGT